jgi:hypothetical protein
MIGVACAHVSQVNAVRERLGPDLSGVFVETANRFHGLERPLMFVHHPLSGRADATGFHLDAGRLCVMLSSQRINCRIFPREGIGPQLRRYAPTGDRVLGIPDDPELPTGGRRRLRSKVILRSMATWNFFSHFRVSMPGGAPIRSL